MFKDSMFVTLFGSPEEARKLYNALTNSNYGPETEIVITTLKNVFYLACKNDLSFLIDGKLIIIVEHQSTLNPNMPMRMFLYAAEVFQSLIDQRTLYGGKLELPRPEFIVVYNGPDALADTMEQRLSDLFKQVAGHDRVDLEAVVKVININNGRNEEILSQNEHLKGYAVFVEQMNMNLASLKGIKQENALRIALKRTTAYCLEHDILKDFIIRYGGRLMNMLRAEFNIKTAERIWKEEAMAEGIAKGLTEGIAKGLTEGKAERSLEIAQNLVALGLSIEQIAQATQLDADKIKNLRP